MIFCRRSRAIASTGNPLDDQTLAAVAARSNLAEPRHWVHYLYFADQASARRGAEAIGHGGWGIQRVGVGGDGKSWVVIAEKHGVVTSPEAVRDARIFFEGIDGADYDGWEASV